jgi:protein-disulfide isomerase
MPSAAAENTATEPLAEVNGEAITAKELERVLGARLATIEEQLYNLKRQGLEGLIAERLLAQEAARRGVSVAALLEAEVTAKAAPVTDEEVDIYYHANKARLAGDEGTVRQNVRGRLQQQKVTAARARFLKSIQSQAKILVRLQPPAVVRLAVSTEGAPSRGAAQAPVTLVEFSDYQCPFCKRAQVTVKQVLDRYPGKVRHVYRDFPVEKTHPQAGEAAEAARCAHDQGKFWQYHDLLFTNAPKAGPEDLRRYAEQAALDVPTFERCVSSGVHRTKVQRDVEDGRRLGITGTPAFFINGRPLTGAQPLEAFARVIEEELARP